MEILYGAPECMLVHKTILIKCLFSSPPVLGSLFVLYFHDLNCCIAVNWVIVFRSHVAKFYCIVTWQVFPNNWMQWSKAKGTKRRDIYEDCSALRCIKYKKAWWLMKIFLFRNKVTNISARLSTDYPWVKVVQFYLRLKTIYFLFFVYVCLITHLL